MFDSHCHLTDLLDPIDALLQAQSNGVRSVLTCGYNLESNQALIGLRGRVLDLPVAIGLHPWHADQELAAVLAAIERERPEVVGEIGLDLWGETPVHPLEIQMNALEAQLQLAAKLALPVTLHSRKAIDPLLSALRNHPGVLGALHAFSGSYEQLRPFLELGMYVGIGGAVTRARAKRVHRLAAAVPIDRLLLETDAPAIGLDIAEPPDVRPVHLVRVAQRVAELRKMQTAELERLTDDNAARLFGASVLKTPRLA